MAKETRKLALSPQSVWEESPETVKRFLEQRPQYEQLCSEVEYILKKRIEDKGIEVAAVTSRAKTLDSFVEKVNRNNYGDPFADIEDFAGVRVVCLYSSDLPLLEKIINKEFSNVKKVDKSEERAADTFGYSAVHFVATLGAKSSGARYEDLKELKCEIQTRTVCQDAWAIISHHLDYKKKEDVPTELREDLFAWAAFFGQADKNFDHIRKERKAYKRRIERESKAKRNEFLDQEVNYDTLAEYVAMRFPGEEDLCDNYAHYFLRMFDESEVSKLSDIDTALRRTEKAREAIWSDSPSNRRNPARDVHLALAFSHPASYGILPETYRNLIDKHRHLCEK